MQREVIPNVRRLFAQEKALFFWDESNLTFEVDWAARIKNADADVTDIVSQRRLGAVADSPDQRGRCGGVH